MTVRTLKRQDALPPNEAVVRVLRDDLTLDPENDPRLGNDEVLHLYRHMVMTRQLDERLVALQRQGRIGFHVGSLGEEAAILGAAYAMRQGDFLFPCYREFGAALMRGLELQVFMHNMFGNAKDTVLGRQMPDHYTCRRVGWGSISSPVGTQITQAVGFAWGAKIQKKDVATLAYFGDGATSSSDFHSGMNFAGVFKIPTVFFCRNNGWAISVPVERQTASRTFAEKAAAYGIAGVRVDGNDLFAVVSSVAPRGRARRARRRPDLDRGHHLPHGRPLHERRPEPLPRQRDAGAVGVTRSDRARARVPREARALGRRRRGALDRTGRRFFPRRRGQRRAHAAAAARVDVRGRLRAPALASSGATRRPAGGASRTVASRLLISVRSEETRWHR